MAFVDGFLLCWYLLTLLSLVFLIYDQITNTPSMWVMALAWFLVLIYTGPLGLFFYFLSCRNPMRGMHTRFISVHWKQAFGSEIHCVAGDATAIIIAAAVLHYLSLPNGLESVIEYVSAYLFGLFVFQALFMLTMFDSYWTAVRRTVFAETVSMNLIMTGMLPVILIFKALFPITSDPLRPYFWGLMSLATMVGFLIGYPINSWMVRKGIKHGMMSRRTAEEVEQAPQGSCASRAGGHGMPGGATAEGDMHPRLPWGEALWHIVWTYATLILVFWVVSWFVPVTFA